MMSFWTSPPKHVENLLRFLGEGPMTVQALAERGRTSIPAVVEFVARLAKLGLVELHASGTA
jgi:Mn-dependent DtxR family transcriptional regulator